MYLPLMALILKGEDLTHILKVLLMGGFYIYINLGILSLCTEP